MTAKRLILVDANPGRRAFWRSHLVSLPFCRLVGESGEMVRGGQMAHDLRPDLMLIGHELPECGGLHLARKVGDALPGTAMVMVAATARSADLIQALRAGVRDYLVNPSPHEMRAALARLAGDTGPILEPAGSGQVISCFSLKGGVGQSSLALNLAIALHQESAQPVVVVDLNGRQGQLDLLMDLFPTTSWLDVVSQGAPLTKALQVHRSGLMLIQASRTADLPTPDQVQGLIQALQKRFAYVVIDADRRPSPGTLTALRLSRQVMVPLGLDLGGLRATQLGLQVLDEAAIPAAHLQLVAIGRRQPGGLPATVMADLLKRPLAWQVPYDSVTATQAIDQGLPYLLGAPRSELSTAVRQLARDLAGMADAPVDRRGVSGLWARLRQRYQPERRTYWRTAQ